MNKNYLKYIIWVAVTWCALVRLVDSKAGDANTKLKKCCKAYEPLQHNKTAVDECLNKFCDFDSLSQTNVLVFLKHCNGTVVGNMFACASSNHDHTPCCKANGVRGRCLEYCSAQDGVPTNYLDYVACLDHFNVIRDCFKNYLDKHPAIKS
ncbi:unnamed protein product [Gongylonema pulchrum]|uniref:DB domain-containing protein n=1 Tax=Gongylonema pulchrum TaxID=637853 RepID=A0A183D138_9BILA|nr:unnamed protein product [Gongylonema pulchrum]